MATKAKTKSWQAIREQQSKISPERRREIDASAHLEGESILAKMKLSEMRRARALSQEQLASELSTNQGGISRLERQTDHHISTLRRFVHALGGELNITASFPGGELIQIHGLGEIDEAPRIPSVKGVAIAPQSKPPVRKRSARSATA